MWLRRPMHPGNLVPRPYVYLVCVPVPDIPIRALSGASREISRTRHASFLAAEGLADSVVAAGETRLWLRETLILRRRRSASMSTDRSW